MDAWKALLVLLQCFTVASRSSFTRHELIRTDVGLDDVEDMTVAGWADFNSDHYTDVLMLTGDQRTLQVFLWVPKTVKNSPMKFKPTAAKIYVGSGRRIINAVVGDWNMDGKADVLVQFKENNVNEILQRVYYGTDGIAFGMISHVRDLRQSSR